MQIVGGIMVIAAVVLLQIEQGFDENAPDVIRTRRGLPNRDTINN
jgi:hypothetical protein